MTRRTDPLAMFSAHLPAAPPLRLSRRRWLQAAAVAPMGWPLVSRSDGAAAPYGQERWFALAPSGPSGRVVVVGGGMAGATVAKYLRLWGGTNVQVTLVDVDARYVSNIMSNLALSGDRALDALVFDHALLVARYGVQRVQAKVLAVDAAVRNVHLDNGQVLGYDRLVLAPGLAFDDAWGLTQVDYDTRTPHAWRAGPQTALLRDQIAAMPAGGTFAMVIPKAPYRCPPGPYERACVVADHLKRTKGSASRVLVLDENPAIVVEAETFGHAFAVTHGGIVDYQPGVVAVQIDPAGGELQWQDVLGIPYSRRADVINPIAPQRAAGTGDGGWLAQAGLANGVGGRWAAVDLLSYESTAVSGVHVIGDAAQTGLPKAGHVANQEAKICADAIVRLLSGQAPDPAPVANSACFSPITRDTASWLSTVYQYDPATRSMRAAADNGRTDSGRAIESAVVDSGNYQRMAVWFDALMNDSFA